MSLGSLERVIPRRSFGIPAAYWQTGGPVEPPDSSQATPWETEERQLKRSFCPVDPLQLTEEEVRIRVRRIRQGKPAAFFELRFPPPPLHA